MQLQHVTGALGIEKEEGHKKSIVGCSCVIYHKLRHNR